MSNPGVGHNSIAGEQLKALITRIENIEAEKKDLSDDVRSIYREAKEAGLDLKVLRAVLKYRKKTKAEHEAETAKTEVYLHALGML